MKEIIDIKAREILDSRGFPTIEVDVKLADGSLGRAAVPSGASTGSKEAHELRDGDENRFASKGVTKAVQAVNGEIKDSLIGMESNEQVTIDNLLIQLDGTKNKSRLGANSILAVSLAMAKASAISYEMPLYQYLGGVFGHVLPVPLMNILNGGAHADNMIDIQEFMITPLSAGSIAEAIRMGAEVFYSLKTNLKQSGFSTNTGDEGGFAPNLNSSQEALDFILKSIKDTGLNPGDDIAIALDCAASEFYNDGFYYMKGTNQKYKNSELVNYYKNLVNDYPIVSIEDPMSEYDEEGWKIISEEMGSRLQIVGDDLMVTNSEILTDCVQKSIANSILVKPNQIGTMTETLRTVEVAHKAGYSSILSHRSGETEDSTISHIAVATNCGQIKTGSLSRTDRTAKYNELLRIEEYLGKAATYPGGKIFSTSCN